LKSFDILFYLNFGEIEAVGETNKFSVICETEKDTAFVAAAIAPLLQPGDAIMLKGSLAGGKTFFVKALISALGSEAEVTSPTFTLAHFYPTHAGMFLHMDAYRLSSIAEFRALGLQDFTAESITAVEWGNKVERDFPDSLSIEFEFVNGGEACRKLTIYSFAERWRSSLPKLRSRLCHLKP
jgi:tRNA threonylcarbamoyladenosine biosynthesis protein TsaE